MPERTHPVDDPALIHASRLADRRAEADRLDRQARRLSDARLIVFLVVVVLALVVFRWRTISPVWLVPPAVVFVALLIGSDAVRRWQEPARRRVSHHVAALERIEGRWMGRGEPGTSFAQEDHPFDLDLDLFGTGSVFERLCTARTQAGRKELADWLLVPAELEEIARRQEAARELRPRVDLREDLSVLGERVCAGLTPESLVSWGEAPPRLESRWLPYALGSLSALNLGGLVWWIQTGNALGFLLAAMVSGAVATVLRSRVRDVLDGITEKADELKLLAALVARIEREPFEAPWLIDLRKGMESGGVVPSRRIGRLAFLASLLDYRRNQLFLPLALLLFWSTQLALAVERWRSRSGRGIANWMRAVGRFEALNALSGYAFECPSDPFPEFVSEGPIFDAKGLGHPLLPLDRCVRNDIVLGAPGAPRLLLVTGSNMSGKSTMLRTIGVNTVLAQAGAPVRAVSLRLSPLSVGATLRVQDSLQAGRSRFYAEITRLRQIVDLSRGSRPLLYLLDEILHGTNSHDRRAGAEALLRTLADSGAIGLVTTHDLALAELTAKLGVPAANVHFEDHLEGGQMTFDYIMRPGVVSKSNALELMRAIGLNV